MIYSLVNPTGQILGDPHEFDSQPPTLHPSKGRWVPDIAPIYDGRLYTAVRVLPVEVSATSISYTLVPVTASAAAEVAVGLVDEYAYQESRAGFTCHHKLISRSHDDMILVLGAAVAALVATSQGVSYNVVWPCEDGTTLNLDAAGVMDMAADMMTQVLASKATSRQLKANIADQAKKANPSVQRIVDAATAPAKPKTKPKTP